MTNTAKDGIKEIEQFSSSVMQKAYLDHSGTEGFSTDGLHYFALKLGLKTHAVNADIHNIRFHLANAGPNGQIYLIRFSLGAMITAQALKYLTAAERSRINLYTMGPAKIISPTGLNSAKNYINHGDGVPFFADTVNYIKAEIRNSPHVKFGYSGTYGLNHSLKAYGWALREIGLDINLRQGKL